CAIAVRDLLIRDDLFDVLGADYHTLARIEASGFGGQFAFTPETRETRVTVGGAGEGGRATLSFFLLGVEHILSGYDHLLFLLGLNLGVEAGQALVVALALPALVTLRRTDWEPRMVTGSSLAILVIGLVLFVERVFL